MRVQLRQPGSSALSLQRAEPSNAVQRRPDDDSDRLHPLGQLQPCVRTECDDGKLYVYTATTTVTPVPGSPFTIKSTKDKAGHYATALAVR